MGNLKVAILGSGTVGSTANGFLKYGYEVMRGSRNPSKLSEWKSKSSKNAKIGTFEESALFGDILVLAVKGTAAEQVIKSLSPSSIKGKTIIDVTNPIAEVPPTNGVLSFFTSANNSLMEILQKAAPQANFVKAFSCVGGPFMVNPSFPDGKPTMFICGTNSQAKGRVREILQFGWDTGVGAAARAIEPICILWCIPGLLNNKWGHAFKLLKT